MASAKLTNFAICLLIILHYNSFVNAHESTGRKIKFAAKIPYEEDAFVHKVNKNGEYVGDHKRIEGRKMLQREVELNKRSEEAKQELSNHEPNIPGNVAIGKQAFQWISPPSIEVSTNSKVDHQDSKNFNGDESEEDEVVNMMRKDYKGPDKPRHKPPINNHNPTDWP